MRRFRHQLVLSLVLAALVVPVAKAHAATTYYLSTGGHDTSSCATGGSQASPWKSFTFALQCLVPGDTLIVHGGTYPEHFNPPSIRHPATSTSPILVQAAPGERPIVYGYLNIRSADYWTFDGINVKGDGTNTPALRLMNGIGWTYKNAEIWNAHSVAGVFIGATSGTGDPPMNWTLSGNCIHHTYATNGTNMDHNIYVSGADFGNGLIERNTIFYAPNGENIKLGGSTAADRGAGHVTVRYNTMYYASQNVVVAWKSHDNTIEHNILSRSMGKDWYPNIRGFDVTGTGNIARDNIGYDAARLIYNTDNHSNPVSRGVRDAGGNHFPINPSFKSTSSCSGLAPQTGSVRAEGRRAPVGSTVIGDWDGDGVDSVGYVRNGVWYLRNSNSTGGYDSKFTFGTATDRFVVGDWNGDGIDTPGIYRNGTWYLRNHFTSDTGRYVVTWGRSTDIPVVGDWDGNGTDTPGLVRGSTWYLRNHFTSDTGRYTASFGTSTDIHLVGDWNGNGTDTPGLMRGNTWYERASNSSSHTNSFTFGTSTDWPIAGDWDGNATATPGIVRIDQWTLRSANGSSGSTSTFTYPG